MSDSVTSGTRARAKPKAVAVAMDDYAKHLYDALHEAYHDYDQAILTITGATLALSVTFAHDVTPTPAPSTIQILLVAWGVLLVALLGMILSFITSQLEIRHMIGKLPAATTSWRGALTTSLNLLAGVALVVGLILLAYYAFKNLWPGA